jgi:hypothetical protein
MLEIKRTKRPSLVEIIRTLFVKYFFKCADCGRRLSKCGGLPGGWILEDGRRVCSKCNSEDFRRIVRKFEWLHKCEGNDKGIK